MSSVFGNGQILGASGSETSSQTNQAYPYLQSALSGTVGTGGAAGSQIANMLGLNGTPAQSQGFQNWQNSTGYQFGLNQGVNSITGNAATQGLLNSGSTLKAVDTYGQNYANTQYGNYVGQLQSLLGSGNQAAGILGSAGTVQNSSKSGDNGLGQLIGKGASMVGL